MYVCPVHAHMSRFVVVVYWLTMKKSHFMRSEGVFGFFLRYVRHIRSDFSEQTRLDLLLVCLIFPYNFI